MDKVFALDLLKQDKISIPKQINQLAEQRMQARKNKDWKSSDELRKEIQNQGWEIQDTKESYDLKKI